MSARQWVSPAVEMAGMWRSVRRRQMVTSLTPRSSAISLSERWRALSRRISASMAEATLRRKASSPLGEDAVAGVDALRARDGGDGSARAGRRGVEVGERVQAVGAGGAGGVELDAAAAAADRDHDVLLPRPHPRPTTNSYT